MLLKDEAVLGIKRFLTLRIKQDKKEMTYNIRGNIEKSLFIAFFTHFAVNIFWDPYYTTK